MSWVAIKWIHELAPDAVDPTGRHILEKLAYRHDEETGECAPGKPWIAWKTSLSDGTVKKWLPRLEREGWFRSERRKAVNGRDDSTQYHLNIGFQGKGAADAPQGSRTTPSTQGEPDAPQGSAITPTRGHGLPGGGVNPSPLEGSAAAPQLQDNNQTTTDKDQDPAPAALGTQTDRKLLGFDDFYKAYPQHRRKYRGDVEKVWNKLKPSQETIRQMLEALAWQVKQRDWTQREGQFVPYPTRYLRAKGWLDERPGPTSPDGEPRQGIAATPEPPPVCTCATGAGGAAPHPQLASALKALLPTDEYAAWGARMHVIAMEPRRVVLGGAPNAFYKSRAEKQYRRTVIEALQAAVDGSVLDTVRVEIRVNVSCAVHPERVAAGQAGQSAQGVAS